VGYILCCIDFNDYCRKMKKIFLPIVRRSNFKQYLLARIEMSLNKKQVRQGYTAHMHIDILPEYQRIGVGRRLVDELVKHLQAIGVSRLTLTCSVSNTKGVNFYRQYGFKDIGKLPGAIIFGLDIVNKNLE
ncbi:MAG: GNAT family N-acetyltransferase, partial [Clostridia bacterium]